MPWAKEMKKFADMLIANIDNDTYKNFCKLVASYCTNEHKDNKTDIAYKDTVKAFVAVVRRWHKEENDNPNFIAIRHLQEKRQSHKARTTNRHLQTNN